MTPNLITGPSHAHRLRNCNRTGQTNLSFGEVVGVGGMPIWSPRIKSYLTRYKNCFHIVGDFRFGNRILYNVNSPEEIASSDKEFTAVDKGLISAENDKIMFEAAKIALDSIVVHNTGETKLLFWDLSIREFEARRDQRYTFNGKYEHPTWNLSSILTRYPSAIDTTDLLDDASAFYVDSSAHPSIIGWAYIFDRILERNRSASELKAQFHHIFNLIFDCIKNESAEFDEVYILGNSKFVRILSSFKDKGVISLPDWINIVPNFDHDCHAKSKCLLFPALMNFKSKINTLDPIFLKTVRYRDELTSNGCDVSVLLYDNWATQNVYKRVDYIKNYTQHAIIPAYAIEDIICHRSQKYCISDSTQWGGMIEFADSLIPSTLGIMEILIRAITGENKEYSDYYYNKLLHKIFNTI